MNNNEAPALATDYDGETLISEWKRTAAGVYTGRDGWTVIKLNTNNGFSWITVQPDGTRVLDRQRRLVGYRSALSAQLEASALIQAAAKA